jgi:hypothetical protein
MLRRKGSSSIRLRRRCRVRMPAASALDREGTLLTPHTRRFSWPAVQAQFGAGFKDIKHFKPSFVIYPDSARSRTNRLPNRLSGILLAE